MLRSADWWLVTDVSAQPIETSVSNGKLRCVTSQKSEDLIYTAAEAWNQARRSAEHVARSGEDKCTQGLGKELVSGYVVNYTTIV